MSHFIGLSPLFIQNALQWAQGAQANLLFYDLDPSPVMYSEVLPDDARLAVVPMRIQVDVGPMGFTFDPEGLVFPPHGDVLKAGSARVGRLAIPSLEGEAWVTMSVAEGLFPDYAVSPLWVSRQALKPSDKMVVTGLRVSFASLFVK